MQYATLKKTNEHLIYTQICCPVAYQNNRIFAILLRYRLIYDERKGHWGLISGFEQLYIVAETDKKHTHPYKIEQMKNHSVDILKRSHYYYAVAIWPVTVQGFQNTKWPAVLYYQ